MSHLFIKAACASAGLVLALAAAGTAHAAKPLSVKQKNDMARTMARSHAAKSAPPKTTAKAEATLMVGPGGTESIEIPEDLHHYLTAQPDANGRMRVRDTDANAQPAAAVETTNEK